MNFVSFISKTCRVLVILALFAGFTAKAEAMDYGVGTEGIKASTLGAPGFYYIMYNMVYTADKLMDDNGNESAVKPDADAFISVHRFIKITKYKFLGANYTFDVLVPIASQDVDMRVGGVSVQSGEVTQVGDITSDIIALPWHGERWDALFATAITIPIGNYNENSLVNASNDHFSALFTLGGTYYPDVDKKWSVALQSRTEIHAKNEHQDIKEGTDFLLEGGVARTFGTADLGISGYAHWQVTDDEGDDVTSTGKERQFGLGPEADLFVPSLGAIFKVKYYKQFGTKNALEGDQVWLTFVKMF